MNFEKLEQKLNFENIEQKLLEQYISSLASLGIISITSETYTGSEKVINQELKIEAKNSYVMIKGENDYYIIKSLEESEEKIKTLCFFNSYKYTRKRFECSFTVLNKCDKVDIIISYMKQLEDYKKEENDEDKIKVKLFKLRAKMLNEIY